VRALLRVSLFRRAASPLGTPIGSPRERGPRATVHTATDGRDVLLNDPDGWEVDQPWLWFTGPKGSNGSGGPYGNPLVSGIEGDPTGLAALPAVNRCTSIIADTLAGLPWRIVRGEYEQLAPPDWIVDPQATRLDGRVVADGGLLDARLSGVEFWCQWIVAALWFGDGYVYAPVRDAAGAPKPPLWQLHPYRVSIEAGTYWVGDVPLPPGSILHLRGMPPYYNGQGRGVIDVHGLALGLAATVQTYAAGVFASGVPAGFLKSSQPNLSQEAATALKTAWLAQHGGAARSIAVLNATTDFTPVQISPVDAQLGNAREWSLRDTAIAFGVPPYMLGVPGDSSTYANVVDRMLELTRFTHLPWARRIEGALSAELPRGTNLKIALDGLLRADTKSRYDGYKIAIEAGFMTVDEVRALEDRPPFGEQGVA
jgi:HK97 family phage portal protein